jgi:hypothetical protein
VEVFFWSSILIRVRLRMASVFSLFSAVLFRGRFLLPPTASRVPGVEAALLLWSDVDADVELFFDGLSLSPNDFDALFWAFLSPTSCQNVLLGPPVLARKRPGGSSPLQWATSKKKNKTTTISELDIRIKFSQELQKLSSIRAYQVPLQHWVFQSWRLGGRHLCIPRPDS